jgi:hypothetical protein
VDHPALIQDDGQMTVPSSLPDDQHVERLGCFYFFKPDEQGLSGDHASHDGAVCGVVVIKQQRQLYSFLLINQPHQAVTVATGRRALSATCQLLASGLLPDAQAGLVAWLAADPLLRVGTFERSGVDASARFEGGRIIVELNARYLFEDATRAAPVVVHQLALIGQPDWPGATITAQAEVAALREQSIACGRLSLPDGVPRACFDAEELLAADDPVADLVAVGFRDGAAG